MAAPSDDGGLRQFLLQRSIQTLCYQYRGCRDSATAQWISERSGVDEMLHGIDGLPVDWRRWLGEMLASPEEELVVESVLKQHRGLSSNNPFLQPKPMTMIYNVQPADVAERIIQTALQLAIEWREDLSKLEAETEAVWRVRRASVLDDDTEVRETLPAFSADPEGDGGDTPFRVGNWDLLQALATRQAVKACLASLATSKSGGAAHGLLAKYCEESGGGSMFEGELRKQSAVDFVSGLLDLPVTLRMGIGGGGDASSSASADTASPTLVDPRTVCEELLEWRVMVANQWVEQLEEIPAELIQVKRDHIENALKGASDGGTSEDQAPQG